MKIWERYPGKWYVRFRHQGKQHWIFAGHTKSAAMDFSRSIRQSITLDRLNLPGVPKPKKNSDCLFETAAGRYLDECYTVKADTTYRREAWRIRGVLFKFFLGVRLSEITLDDVLRFKASRKVSPRTLFNDLQTLKSIFNFAIRSGLYSGTDPVGNLPKIYQPEIEIYTPEQIENYLSCCPDYYYPIAAILIFTGLRPIELRALKRSDVDLQRDMITVRATASLKNTKGREIPINSQLRPILEAHLDSHDSEYVICGRLGKRTKLSHGHWIARKTAGMPNLRLYHLRHMFATLTLADGKDPAAVAVLMGHKSIDITMRIYHHLHPERAKRVIESMPKIVNGCYPVARKKLTSSKLLIFKKK